MQIPGHIEQWEERKGGLVALSTYPGMSGKQTSDDFCKDIFKKNPTAFKKEIESKEKERSRVLSH